MKQLLARFKAWCRRRFDDWRREQLIDQLCGAVAKAAVEGRREDAQTLWREVERIHAQRSPEQVARMERKLGVRHG